MIKKEFVREYELQLSMFKKCIPQLTIIIEDGEVPRMQQPLNYLREDALDSLESIYEINDIKFEDALPIILALSIEFSKVEGAIKDGLIDIFKDLKDESYWEAGQISTPIYVFYGYTFITQLYKSELNKLFLDSNLLLQVYEELLNTD